MYSLCGVGGVEAESGRGEELGVTPGDWGRAGGGGGGGGGGPGEGVRERGGGGGGGGGGGTPSGAGSGVGGSTTREGTSRVSVSGPAVVGSGGGGGGGITGTSWASMEGISMISSVSRSPIKSPCCCCCPHSISSVPSRGT